MAAHRLTPALVTELRERRAAGEPVERLAAAFDVTEKTVRTTCRGETNRSAPGPLSHGVIARRPTRRAITGAERQEIVSMRTRGTAVEQIARHVQRSVTTVAKFLKREQSANA